jgi:hypothetical protein
MRTVIGVCQINGTADRIAGIIQAGINPIIGTVLPIGGARLTVAGTVLIAILGVEQGIEQSMGVKRRLWRLRGLGDRPRLQEQQRKQRQDCVFDHDEVLME